MYNQIQQYYVKRSESKKQTMAACLYYSCLERGFAPSQDEISEFMTLKKKNFANGITFVNKMVDENLIDGVEIDIIKSEVYTFFRELNDELNPLRDEVVDLIKKAERLHIGLRSQIKSKVIGSTYVILQKNKSAITLNEMIKIKSIRAVTVQSYINCLIKYSNLING